MTEKAQPKRALSLQQTIPYYAADAGNGHRVVYGSVEMSVIVA